MRSSTVAGIVIGGGAYSALIIWFAWGELPKLGRRLMRAWDGSLWRWDERRALHGDSTLVRPRRGEMSEFARLRDGAAFMEAWALTLDEIWGLDEVEPDRILP